MASAQTSPFTTSAAYVRPLPRVTSHTATCSMSRLSRIKSVLSKIGSIIIGILSILGTIFIYSFFSKSEDEKKSLENIKSNNKKIDELNEKVGDINTEVEEKSEEPQSDFEQAKFNVETYENTQIEKIDNVYKYIGNLFDTYIIIQMKDKMYFVDQHAAHERYLFEQIKEAYYAKDRQTQMLLIPLLIGLSTKEMNIVRENVSMFEDAGFILEEFGENTYKISGVPNVGYNIDHKSMFKDIITELSTTEKTERQEKEHRFLATLACKAAVKGGMKLDVEEQKRLVDNMISLDNPFTCPHGRPTAIPMTRYEIERKFMRK